MFATNANKRQKTSINDYSSTNFNSRINNSDDNVNNEVNIFEDFIPVPPPIVRQNAYNESNPPAVVRQNAFSS